MAFFLNLGNLVVHLTADTVKYEKAMFKAEKTLKRTAKRMNAVGRKMSLALTAPIVAFAAASVRAFAKFDDAMVKSQAIMGNLSDDVKRRMEETARSISTNGIK